MSHTKGTWIASPYSSRVGAPVVASPSGRPVANVTYFALGEGFENHQRESEANARLIAAAPELLDALVYARRFMKPEDFDIEYIDNAIKKAKGE